VSKKIAIIGAGKWGSALNFALSFKNKTIITSRTKRDVANFVSLEEALECEFLVICISTQHTFEWLKNNFIFKDQ
jgi:glycerol-3-phosphate dehydrogenase (NAD(P)+)